MFTAEDGTAVQHTVTVLGYDGLLAGVALGQLDLKYPVITKGHERIRNGSKVEIIGAPPLEARSENSGR